MDVVGDGRGLGLADLAAAQPTAGAGALIAEAEPAVTTLTMPSPDLGPALRPPLSCNSQRSDLA